MSHILECNQTEIHRESPGLEAGTVNCFHRETSVLCAAIYIIAVLVLELC
jgi:hypothetical protein